MHRCRLALLLISACVGVSIAARADDATDKAAITERLNHWTTAFNARDAAGICDLFAPDLIAIVPGSNNGSRDALCSNLATLQAQPDLQLHYDTPQLREITISGDTAVVLPVWTLTARKGSDQDVTTEVGIDIFKRQPDGRWSISRMATFTNRPNKILD